MSDTTNQQSAGGYAILIEFLWGTGSAARYTSWTDPIVANGNTFNTVVEGGPNIETRIQVNAAAQTGKIVDEPWQIIMPPVTPLVQLTRQSAFALVTCNIYECDPTAETIAPTLMWAGNVTQVWLNAREVPGFIKAEIAGWRWLIRYPMGTESKTACSRTFGDTLCGFNKASVQQTAVISSISAHVISAPTLSIPSGKPANYFSFGTVTYDGLSISIIDGSAGVSSLRLLQVPPPEWAGVTATFTPGCDKSIKTCTNVWGNQLRFFGIGLSNPSDSPYIGPR